MTPGDKERWGYRKEGGKREGEVMKRRGRKVKDSNIPLQN